MDRNDLLAGAVIAILVAGAAVGGSLAAIDASDQYGALEQPSWAPPGWLFGPVWTVLYIAIAVAGFLTWKAHGTGTDSRLWAGQVVVNGFWTPLFFAWELRLVALFWILLLDSLVVWFMVRNWNTWRAWLMLPYLAWIAFATALNAAVWWHNRS